LKDIYGYLIKSGDAEKLYSRFYSTIAFNAEKIFQGISRNAAALLSTKMADCMLAHTKRKTKPQLSAPSTLSLSKEERAGMQYIGGYILHKLYNKHLSIEKKSPASEQTLAIIKAARGQSNSEIERQQLISVLSRGGLWGITKPMEIILERTEFHFVCLKSNK